VGAPKKYPLASLSRLRDGKVETATRELSAALRNRETAEQVRRAAERDRDHHDRQTTQIGGSECEALSRGELLAVDMVRLDAWRMRVRLESRTLATRVAQAEAEERRAKTEQALAQERLAARKADANVVSEHHARWAEQRTQELQAAEEEAALDLWRPKP
jgi:hypothetical protein